VEEGQNVSREGGRLVKWNKGWWGSNVFFGHLSRNAFDYDLIYLMLHIRVIEGIINVILI
jgi:hypothetical protein